MKRNKMTFAASRDTAPPRYRSVVEEVPGGWAARVYHGMDLVWEGSGLHLTDLEAWEAAQEKVRAIKKGAGQ